jgi:hypothetical protein
VAVGEGVRVGWMPDVSVGRTDGSVCVGVLRGMRVSDGVAVITNGTSVSSGVNGVVGVWLGSNGVSVGLTVGDAVAVAVGVAVGVLFVGVAVDDSVSVSVTVADACTVAVRVALAEAVAVIVD